MKKLTLLMAGILSISSINATAADFLQLGLISPVQLSPVENDIIGLRLNIYGVNQNVTGLDLGIVNDTEGDFKGLSTGIVEFVRGDSKGIHLYWLPGFGMVEGDMSGLQLNGWYFNVKGTMTGIQFAFVTKAAQAKGLQVGLVNIAEDMYGLQVGVVNIIRANKVPFLPIVNARF